MPTRSTLPALGALLLAGLILVGHGTGPDGSPGFAAGEAGVGGLTFAAGWLARRWWLVPALAVGWFLAGYLGGAALDPSGYAWAIGLYAPLVAVFAALGVSAARARRSARRRAR